MHQNYLQEAIFNARKSLLYKSNHGAIVIYRSKIVGRGHNKMCVENINKVNKFSTHAEVAAIKDALRRINKEELKKSILIVIRLSKEGEMVSSIPCNCCTEYIKRCGIPIVYHS